MVIHEYRGDQNELEFLDFVSRTKSLTWVAKGTWMISKLVDLSRETVSFDYKMMVLASKYQNDWSIQKASDLIVDPFPW